MRFALDITINHPEGNVSLDAVAKNAELAKKVLAKPETLEGALVPVTHEKRPFEPVDDPLLSLLEQWMLKVPWLLQGDTETVVLKNSGHAFGLEVVNESVALSFYVGHRSEVEAYLMEPVPVPLDQFCEVSIAAVRQLLGALTKVNPRFATDVADVRLLVDATREAERALKEYKLDRR